ncbi:MAG TPA: hypothetical protein VM509_15735 [Planctomycetota bacterium]|nr:hypothetical protein [Planctomycetota bacterium]
MRQMPRFAMLRLVTFVFALSSAAFAQTTWHVDVHAVPPGAGTVAQPYTSIQYAIARPTTLNNDIVLVAPGEYVENISTQGKSLSLVSSGGPLVTTIRSGQVDVETVVLHGGFPLLQGFTVTGNTTSFLKGSIVVKGFGDATIRRCIVRDNPTGNGILSQWIATVYNCTVTGNLIGIHATNFGGEAHPFSCIIEFNTTNSQADGAHFNIIGTGNPGFWSYDLRDFHLRPSSQAIDAGDPNDPRDPDGSIADVGAVVYDRNYIHGPRIYCAGKLNSQGCVPQIGYTGVPSVSGGTFFVTAGLEIVNKPGLLLQSFASTALPFQGGTLCLQSPIKRLGAQNSTGSGTCGGTYGFDMGAWIAQGHPGVVAGELLCVQWWSRDPLEPAGFGSGLSDALSFGLAP